MMSFQLFSISKSSPFWDSSPANLNGLNDAHFELADVLCRLIYLSVVNRIVSASILLCIFLCLLLVASSQASKVAQAQQ
jgi:hypothetical protein